MEFLLVAGFFIGFIVLVFAFVWLIIQLKKKKVSKVPAIIILVGIALFAITSWTLIGSDNSSTDSAGSVVSAGSSKSDASIKKINKKLPSVGGLEYKIVSIKTEKVSKSSDSKTNAEYNMDSYEDLNDSYYRYTINYNLKNTNKFSADLSTMQNLVMDDNKTEFSRTGSADNFGFDDNNNGEISGGSTTNGKFILVSNHKVNLSHFYIKLSGFSYENTAGDYENVDGGLIEYK